MPTIETSAALDADIRSALKCSDIDVCTQRRTTGIDDADPGMRDFTAALSVYVYIGDWPESELPDWFGSDSWRDVPAHELRALLDQIAPKFAPAALDAAPEDEGVRITLVRLEGSLLNPYRLRGRLYDALDARSATHEALYAALTEQDTYGHPGLRGGLEAQVDGVGNVTLLTHTESSPTLNDIAPGLEVGLVSQVLQDVSDGSHVVLTPVGPLPARSKADKARKSYLEQFWGGLAFKPWRHGIWFADTAFQSFQSPADVVTELLD